MTDLIASPYRLTRDRLELLQHVPFIERHWKKIDAQDNKITIHQSLARTPGGRIIETFRVRPSEQENGPVTRLYLRQYDGVMGIQEGISCMYAPSRRVADKDKAQAILDGTAVESADLVPSIPFGYRKLFQDGVETHYETGVDYAFATYCHDVTEQAKTAAHLEDEQEAGENVKSRHVTRLFFNSSPVRQITALFNPGTVYKIS